MTMTMNPFDSLETHSPATGPQGQTAHPDAIAHLDRLRPEFYSVGEHAWCMVGNGLSNQSFVRGPLGIIAIDSGESVEEMRAAIHALRKVSQEPIVACIYTHFHYVNGTQAILEDNQSGDLKIYGHAGIPANLERFGGEIAPRAGKGLVHQFGTSLPAAGADALLHCGLGLFYRNPEHAPFTPGYIPANHSIDQAMTTQIAGLTVEITPAPSDATDSVTLWFTDLGLCINNLIWPAFFNIYAIRGEEYRDPRVLLSGMDHIIDREPQAVIGTHGPPLIDMDIQTELTRYRDSIQYLWDQTVRRINAGETTDEAAQNIVLPAHLADCYLTRQYYGVTEHHVKQIHAGLFGWFDGDERSLFPLATEERNDRLIRGFGGREKVTAQALAALAEDDVRWALELASWLARSTDATAEDRNTLAQVLRHVGQQTISANIRNWTLTRALHLEGQINLDRLDVHRFNEKQVLTNAPTRFISTLKVLLDPDLAKNVQVEVCWRFSGGESAGLCIRNQVAVPTRGVDADINMGLSHETWARILAGKLNLWDAIDEGIVSIEGDLGQLQRFCSVFDLPSFAKKNSR